MMVALHIKTHSFVSFLLIYSSLLIRESYGKTIDLGRQKGLSSPREKIDVLSIDEMNNNEISEDYQSTPNPAKMSKTSNTEIKYIKCHCDTCADTNYVCETDGVCFYSWEYKDNQYHYSKSCIARELVLTGRLPFVCYSTKAKTETFQAECCNEDFCNDNISHRPEPESAKMAHTGGDLGFNAMYVLICAAAAGALIVFMMLLFMKRQKHNSGGSQLLVEDSTCNQTIQEMFDMTTSGSGSAGLPLLVQRSIARQIQLERIIGNGRFGQVWKGRWRDDNVAVKIFSSREECSWAREAEIYQTAMLRHDNILGFIAADNKDNGTWTQLWLVTDYHENGSLYDFLTARVVSPKTMVQMALTIATGLVHLHMDIVGTFIYRDENEYKENSGKPGIAHRDLKSKNILVRSDLTCAIGDLGLAVRHNPKLDKIDIPSTHRVGTKRYMAPEVLDDTINTNHFDAFKRADVYAFGLILWELARRCNINDDYEDYQLPFYDVVQPDPSIEEMRKVVCDDNQRPTIPRHRLESYALHQMSKIMKDCWYKRPASRLTALRTKKTLASILEVINSNEKLDQIM